MNKITNTASNLLTISEVSRRLGLARQTVHKMINNEQLRCVSAGNIQRIPAWQVTNLLLGYPITNGPIECSCCAEKTETK